MEFNVPTIVFVTSIIFATQTIAVFIQYRVNKTYNGFGLWLVGAVLQAFGFLLMLTLSIKSIWFLSIFANPMVFLGLIFLNIGIKKYLEIPVRKWLSASLFTIFIIFYYYFMFINNSISGRSIVISSSTAVLSILTAYIIYKNKKRHFSGSADFTAFVFFAFGLLHAAMVIVTCILPPIYSYQVYTAEPIRFILFIIPVVGSMLWTFGFIIMVNQRLNAENLEEKEKLEMIFNLSPDVKLITRKSDGLFVNVNAGFLLMTGYTKEETIGKSTLSINFWNSATDRKGFISDLTSNGTVENKEYFFKRKDGSLFIGTISASIITINDQEHIVSVIHDITKRKHAEQKIRDLVQQLKAEKNVAQQNAITDSLTGLSNRRYFDESLRTEFYRGKRSGSPLSVIILDIDHFKKFNDTYGHLAGDDCLRHVSAVLKKAAARSYDIVARYGGEEFVLIMPDTEKNGASKLAEQIRKDVEELAIPHSTSETAACVTVSLGVVTVSATNIPEAEQIIALADEALYEAKLSGRNRIIIKSE